MERKKWLAYDKIRPEECQYCGHMFYFTKSSQGTSYRLKSNHEKICESKRVVEKVTEDLDTDLIQWMDHQIKYGVYENRRHCIEHCLRAKKSQTIE